MLTYLTEKELIEGAVRVAGTWIYFSPKRPIGSEIVEVDEPLDFEWVKVKVTAEGIDYLESLEEKIRLEVEEREREAGFDAYRQQQEEKNE